MDRKLRAADAPLPRGSERFPQHVLENREVDDLALVALGLLDPVPGTGPEPRVRLRLHGSALTGPGMVELVDREGAPVGQVDVAPRADGPPQVGPVHVLYLPPTAHQTLRRHPAEVREQLPDAVVVPVERPLTATDLRLLADHAASGLVLLALTGEGTPQGCTGPALVRATLVAARHLPGSEVVAIPLARREGSDHAALVQHVAAAYGRPIHVPGDGPLPTDVAHALRGDSQHRPGAVVFFTGLSGSGKSTLAHALRDALLESGERPVSLLDGDEVRRHLSSGLTFSREDRETNIRRIGWVAAEIARHGGLAICSPIAPFADTRAAVRGMVGDAGGVFVLVHVATPLEECERRDRKGLYARARRGEVPDFTGISSPYEAPDDADVVVDTTGLGVAEVLTPVLARLHALGILTTTTVTDAEADG